VVNTSRLSNKVRITDIAPLAVFLASDESAWITGEVSRAAGGLVVAT
jgi:enoyl-[acyl-carrier-protein] reductase (NADH)